MTTTMRARPGNFGKRLMWGAAALTTMALVAGCTPGAEAEPDADEPAVAEEPAEPGASFKRAVTDGRTTFYLVENPDGGPRLTFGADAGIDVLTVEDGGQELFFRDINGNGVLDTFEDWREDPAVRAAALAQEVSIEQIVGLMLFSPHQRDPEEGLTEAQEEFLRDEYLRNVLNAGPANVEATVTWVNEMQAFVETLATDETPLIPVNFATDPRSTAGAATYNAEGGNSRWPSNLGLAATFDISFMEDFARTVTAEYRALGMTTALSPMVELATEPRWLRVEGTLGEDLDWATELAAAYIAGYQGSYGEAGWGTESVNAMIKHFAGDGANEGGRGAHTVPGMYEVFHGGMESFRERLSVFTDNLEGTAAVMTGYAVAVGPDGEPLFEPSRGVAFDAGRMGILRDEYNFDGVVVTDWGVTRPADHERPGRAWYMEGMTEGEIMFEGILAGIDMFGGNREAAPVMEAFDIWQEQYEAGELPISAEERWRETGRRVLQMKFQVGLYESPFLVLEESLETVGRQDKMDRGFEAQLAAVVMARNVDGTVSPSTAADWADKTVYIPHTYMLRQPNSERGERDIPLAEGPGLTPEILEMYFGTVLTDEVELDEDGRVLSATAPDLSDVDLVLVGMFSPRNGNQHSRAGHWDLEEYWYPLSLQWGEYVADGPYVRRTSISGRPLEDGGRENRSYFGATGWIQNHADLAAFERAVDAVEATGRDIPIITVVAAMNPFVPIEIYEDSDAIIIGFGTSDQAMLHVALGIHEAQARLPITFPADMDAVERQLEDIADTDPFVDSDGNAWEFGFGLNFSGPIGR